MPDCAGGVVETPPFGIVSVCPGYIMSPTNPFAPRMALTVTPYRWDNENSESPATTLYTVAADAPRQRLRPGLELQEVQL